MVWLQKEADEELVDGGDRLVFWVNKYKKKKGERPSEAGGIETRRRRQRMGSLEGIMDGGDQNVAEAAAAAIINPSDEIA
ncbi:hypothetical protein V6N13_062215 [Hibiscus sabdariffa]|uniref:Uncharacterized protein n=2 Tax=Hibiscus sabdariffa TaxID=183260 RepID=A0ABR2NAJ1_9ROSI